MLVELVYAVASFLAMTVKVVYAVALLCGLQLFAMMVMVVYVVALLCGLQLFGMTRGRDDSWMCF